MATKGMPAVVNAKTWLVAFLCCVLPALPSLGESQPLDLTGRWKDPETGDRFDIVHHDNTVTARFVDADNRCRINKSEEKRDPLFMAELKGSTLEGKLSVCVPEQCVADFSPHRWTDFVAEVAKLEDPPGAEPVANLRFIGTWLDEELDTNTATCTLTGQKRAMTGFDAERLPCDEIHIVSLALERTDQLIAAYTNALETYDGRSFADIQREVEARFPHATAESDPGGRLERGIAEYRNAFRLPRGGACVRDRSKVGAYCCATPQILDCGKASTEFLNGVCLSHEEVHVKNTAILLQYVAGGAWSCGELQEVETLPGEEYALPLIKSEIEAYESDLSAYKTWLDGYQAKFELDCKGAEGW